MNAGNDFEKDFFKLMINSVLWKNNGKFTKKNQSGISKLGKRFFKISQQANIHYP